MNSDIHIVTRGSVTSTMTEARALVMSQELDLPFAVLASSQTDGLGRQGRAWLSDDGVGLYVTFAVPLRSIAQSQGLIALAVGVAICDVLAEMGVDPGLKWPNDVVVGERKIAGVLIQSIADQPGIFLIGIGLNLQSSPVDDDINAVALETLIEESPDTIPLLRKLAGRIGEWLDRHDAGEHHFIVDAWIGYAIWLGAEVEVVTDSVQRGTLLGVDRNGLLILETSAGELSLASGDVQRGPRQTTSPYT